MLSANQMIPEAEEQGLWDRRDLVGLVELVQAGCLGGLRSDVKGRLVERPRLGGMENQVECR
jgi:hypothetical protein